ncbi:hypothetical protein COF68_04675 [Bacillus toyonensis]|uniref:hypothetical protein n=1 Tax=Bacillus toyonensis TaxID=155322 RepID=UPI000BFD0F3E|nr:hypothetical protein [Bacillus toyonensis]PHE64146.1 hypothetical protein COF68_04675 [Bacillus toyonensis]
MDNDSLKGLLRSAISNLESVRNYTENDFISHKSYNVINMLLQILDSKPFNPNKEQIQTIHNIVDTIHTESDKEFDIVGERAFDSLQDLDFALQMLTTKAKEN